MIDSAKLSTLLQQGIAAAKAGRMQEARQVLFKVIELDERNEQAWLWLSSVVESLEDKRVCLENALAINPQNSHALSGLRWLDQQAPPAPAFQERCPRCDSPVPLSKTTCPNCGQALVVICPACGQHTNMRDASCPECNQPLGNYREGVRYHLALARAYVSHQRYTLAQDEIDCIESQASDNSQMLVEIASLYEEMGHNEQAIDTCKRAIKHDPDDAAPYACLGTIYRKRAMMAKASAMYEKAARRANDDPAILFELARLHVETGKAGRKAIRLLQQAIRLSPEHASAHKLLGDVYLDQRLSSQAAYHYERASKSATPGSETEQEARRQLARLRPPAPERESQGWGETLRRMAGLMLSPAAAALVNARLVPWEISLAAWGGLIMASIGAYFWVCAIDVPQSPAMREIFGEAGVKELWQQAIVGIPGVFLWAIAFGIILLKL
jgi:tetratricopeptide (TPR) repeat protein